MSAHPLKDFSLARPTSTTVSPASRRSTTEPEAKLRLGAPRGESSRYWEKRRLEWTLAK